MKKILDFIKKVYNRYKTWIVLNGIEGIIGLYRRINIMVIWF